MSNYKQALKDIWYLALRNPRCTKLVDGKLVPKDRYKREYELLKSLIDELERISHE